MNASHSSVMMSQQQPDVAPSRATYLGVIDTILGDMTDLAGEIGSSSIYDLRKHSLGAWAATLTRSIQMLSHAVDGAVSAFPHPPPPHQGGGDGSAAPGDAAAATAGCGGANSGARTPDSNVVAIANDAATSAVAAAVADMAAHEFGSGGGDTPHAVDEGDATDTAGCPPLSPLSADRRRGNGTRAIGGAGGGGGGGGSNQQLTSAAHAGSHHNINHHRQQQQQQQQLPPQQLNVLNSPQSAVMKSFVAGSVYLLLDALLATIDCSWCSLFIHHARSNELVLVASVGTRKEQRAGTLRLSATSGVESQVLATGVAMNITHAYSEDEFNPAQDAGADGGVSLYAIGHHANGSGGTAAATTGADGSNNRAAAVDASRSKHERTRSELVFPLIKPGADGSSCGSHTIGVLQACNKHRASIVNLSAGGGGGFGGGTALLSSGTFTPEDEHRCAEAAHLLCMILTRHPCDVATPLAFDPSLLLSRSSSDAASNGMAAGRAITIPHPAAFAQQQQQQQQQQRAPQRPQNQSRTDGSPAAAADTAKVVAGRRAPPQAHQHHSATHQKDQAGGGNGGTSASRTAAHQHQHQRHNNHSHHHASSPIATVASSADALGSTANPTSSATAGATAGGAMRANRITSDATAAAASAQTVATAGTSASVTSMSAAAAAAARAESALLGALTLAGGDGTLTIAPPSRHAQLVYRTSKAGHVRRADLLGGAVRLPPIATITDAVEHVASVNAGWRNAVLLNVELEQEVRRFKDQVRSLQRESGRLQAVLSERAPAAQQQPAGDGTSPSGAMMLSVGGNGGGSARRASRV